jgi:HD-GYP domain-containing protein (c-di-GMP phosphodiesterase class II)
LDDDDEFSFAKNIALYHHERFDGTGYPYGLAGEEIPIEARIVALADVYDSLRSKRTYKPALSHEEAYKIIVEGDIKTQPTHFDPDILEIFKKHHLKFKNIYEKK